MEKKRKLSLERKHNLTGWAFLLPAAILIFVFCFYPMIQALMLSFKNGMGDSVRWVGFANYVRILKDKTFLQCLFNTVFYFIIQVPVMLIIALVLAQLLNNPNIKNKKNSPQTTHPRRPSRKKHPLSAASAPLPWASPLCLSAFCCWCSSSIHSTRRRCSAFLRCCWCC